jgi:hypothetical protein
MVRTPGKVEDAMTHRGALTTARGGDAVIVAAFFGGGGAPGRVLQLGDEVRTLRRR